MNDIEKKLAQVKSINEVYALLSQFLTNNLKKSVCILLQLDEKQDKSYVYDLIGLNTPLFNKLIRILGLNPVGKRFNNSSYGRKFFFSSNKFISFKGNLSKLAEGTVSEWICNIIENVFNIKNIYSIGLNYENVLLGSVLVFPRKGDEVFLKYVEKNIVYFSIRMKEILDTYKQDVLGLDTRDIFTKAILHNINHEIRTPLNGIVGLMDVGLRLLKENENTKELTSLIWKNSSELTNKLDKLLVLSDFQTNGLHIKPKKLCVKVIQVEVEQIVIEQRSLNKDRNIILNINEDESYNSEVFVDVYYFKLMLVELINNAIKFSEKDITINLNLNKDIKIEICDEGIGMSEKEITEYVKAFNRNNVISEKYTGIGLGLSIVKIIVEQHNWQISFNSTVDKGTTVTIYLKK